MTKLMNKRLLLLSNSTNPGEAYLGWSGEHIKDFLGESVKKPLFIPFAGVTIPYDDYFKTVSARFMELGYKIESIHKKEISARLIEEHDAIIIGGGNTFQLANQLQKNKLLKPIEKAIDGGKPFIGWSAGSNICCPTIKTTNDMPIVEPESFNGLNLIPFQINPHYTEATIPNHGGESREMRINEFITLNPSTYVVGLPEGSLLRYENEQLFFAGKGWCKIFKYGTDPKTIKDGDDLSWLLGKML
jgi:dipeptidase E